MTLAKHTMLAIDMNTRLPEFKHGMVTSDTERQDSSHHVTLCTPDQVIFPGFTTGYIGHNN